MDTKKVTKKNKERIAVWIYIAIGVQLLLAGCVQVTNKQLIEDSRISTEDRAEILELISEYAYTFDEDRIPDYVALFLEDAEFSVYNAGADSPSITTSTNDERLAVLQEIRSGPINQPGQPRHIQTNTVLTRISSERISGRTMLICTQQPYDGSPCRILFTGVYEDVFQKTDRGWRFAVRKAFLDSA